MVESLVSVWGMRPGEMLLDTLELELQVVWRQLTWVLGILVPYRTYH